MANTTGYYGEPGGARTRDHRIKSAMLYQLSYRPMREADPILAACLRMGSMGSPHSLVGMEACDIETLLGPSHPKFRAQQIYDALYRQRVTELERITGL